MNIRSLFQSLVNRAFSTETAKVDQRQNLSITPKGITAYSDSFEPAQKAVEGLSTRNNYFSGKQLDAESLAGEQGYGRRDSGESKSGKVVDQGKLYSSVIMQEGRVKLDADYNEDTSETSEDDD